MSYYNARWYDAQVGMFISADTLVPSPGDPRTFNRYAYVSGNPLKFVDPSGHLKLCGAACEDAYNWSPKTTVRKTVAPLDAGRRVRAYKVSYVRNPYAVSFVRTPRPALPPASQNSIRIPSTAPQMGPAPAGASDKASILQYEQPAYLRPRLETWHGVASDAEVAEGSGGFRRVRTWNGVFDWSEHDDHWEYVVDISAQYKGFEAGAECSQGKCAPAIGLDFQIVSVGLQPGNIMVGGKWGATGGAVGFDFFWGSKQFLIASPATILAKGPTALGQAFFGKDARFLGVVETFNGTGGRSAMDKAQGFLNQYGFSYKVAR